MKILPDKFRGQAEWRRNGQAGYEFHKQSGLVIGGRLYSRDSAANLGINCFIQNTKKLKQPSLMLLNTRYEALAAKFECVDTFEF